MARLARLSVPGHMHLMIQRAQQGQAVFADPMDRRAYLHCLAEAAAKHGVTIHGYGMAPAEVRLLVTPADASALGRMVQFVGRRYVAGFNRRHGRTGALWEGRFRATVVEPGEYFLRCLRYVEAGGDGRPRDPVADEAPWSSADHHAGQRTDPFVTEHAQFWFLGNTPFEREAAYRNAMTQPMTQAEVEGIALASLHGWVLGSAAFERTLAAQLGRRLRPLSPGRPPVRRTNMLTEISDPK